MPFDGKLRTARQIEAEIGSRLARLRLSRNVTQSMLAEDAGVGVRTLRRLEAGEPSTLDTFLRVALALDLSDALLGAIPTGHIRPIERVSRTGFERRRARPQPRESRAATWIWGDGSGD